MRNDLITVNRVSKYNGLEGTCVGWLKSIRCLFTKQHWIFIHRSRDINLVKSSLRCSLQLWSAFRPNIALGRLCACLHDRFNVLGHVNRVAEGRIGKSRFGRLKTAFLRTFPKAVRHRDAVFTKAASHKTVASNTVRDDAPTNGSSEFHGRSLSRNEKQALPLNTKLAVRSILDPAWRKIENAWILQLDGEGKRNW